MLKHCITCERECECGNAIANEDRKLRMQSFECLNVYHHNFNHQHFHWHIFTGIKHLSFMVPTFLRMFNNKACHAPYSSKDSHKQKSLHNFVSRFDTGVRCVRMCVKASYVRSLRVHSFFFCLSMKISLPLHSKW